MPRPGPERRARARRPGPHHVHIQGPLTSRARRSVSPSAAAWETGRATPGPRLRPTTTWVRRNPPLRYAAQAHAPREVQPPPTRARPHRSWRPGRPRPARPAPSPRPKWPSASWLQASDSPPSPRGQSLPQSDSPCARPTAGQPGASPYQRRPWWGRLRTRASCCDPAAAAGRALVRRGEGG